jgi:ankyrin repeat protein
MDAIRTHNQTLLDAHFQQGYDPNVSDDHGRTAFLYALERGHIDLACWLVKRGADPTCRNQMTRQNALHVWLGTRAYLKDRFESPVSWLLEAGVSPGQKDREGNTPLHLAARSGRLETVRLLLEYRPRDRTVLERVVLQRNNQGQTPYEMLRESVPVSMNRSEVAAVLSLLRTYENKVNDTQFELELEEE